MGNLAGHPSDALRCAGLQELLFGCIGGAKACHDEVGRLSAQSGPGFVLILAANDGETFPSQEIRKGLLPRRFEANDGRRLQPGLHHGVEGLPVY